MHGKLRPRFFESRPAVCESVNARCRASERLRLVGSDAGIGGCSSGEAPEDAVGLWPGRLGWTVLAAADRAASESGASAADGGGGVRRRAAADGGGLRELVRRPASRGFDGDPLAAAGRAAYVVTGARPASTICRSGQDAGRLDERPSACPSTASGTRRLQPTWWTTDSTHSIHRLGDAASEVSVG